MQENDKLTLKAPPDSASADADAQGEGAFENSFFATGLEDHDLHLDPKQRRRLRRIYHWTTADTALRILRSGHIWSDAPEGYANFSINRNPFDYDEHRERAEVSLTFNWTGSIHFVPEDFDPKLYAADVLYVHLARGGVLKEGERLDIRHMRLAAGSVFGLRCEGYRQSSLFRDRCSIDMRAAILEYRIEEALAGRPRSIRIPATRADIEKLKKAHPEMKFSPIEIHRAHFGMINSMAG